MDDYHSRTVTTNSLGRALAKRKRGFEGNWKNTDVLISNRANRDQEPIEINSRLISEDSTSDKGEHVTLRIDDENASLLIVQLLNEADLQCGMSAAFSTLPKQNILRDLLCEAVRDSGSQIEILTEILKTAKLDARQRLSLINLLSSSPAQKSSIPVSCHT